MYLSEGARHILTVLSQSGYEAYAVGGCVRDMLLGKIPHDYDICTSALPEQILHCFSGYKTLTVGMKHGTVTVLYNAVPYEITTYRTDGTYSDNRHPDKVHFVRSLYEDLIRRDFTVNAMAYNLTDGLKDFFGGKTDLQNKIIRCVGSPDQRFSEDALRILRALRFASVLGFSLHEQTVQAIHRNKHLLQNIAAERIRDELLKLLCGQGVANILTEYADVFCVFIPEIKPCIGFAQDNPHHCYDVWTHIVHTVGSVQAEPLLRLTMLLHDISKPQCRTTDKLGIGHFYGHCSVGAKTSEKILRRLRFDNHTIRTVTTLILNHDERPKDRPALRRLIAAVGKNNMPLLIAVQRADAHGKTPSALLGQLAYIQGLSDGYHEILAQNDCLTLSDLAVKGNDLISLGIPSGKSVGTVLNTLLNAVIDGTLPNDKSVLLSEASRFRK